MAQLQFLHTSLSHQHLWVSLLSLTVEPTWLKTEARKNIGILYNLMFNQMYIYIYILYILITTTIVLIVSEWYSKTPSLAKQIKRWRSGIGPQVEVRPMHRAMQSPTTRRGYSKGWWPPVNHNQKKTTHCSEMSYLKLSARQQQLKWHMSWMELDVAWITQWVLKGIMWPQRNTNDDNSLYNYYYYVFPSHCQIKTNSGGMMIHNEKPSSKITMTGHH